MHPIQKKILELAQVHDLKNFSLRQIGRMIGETHPQKIKHHLQQLNLLPKSRTEALPPVQLVSIPVVGMANCGEATVYAEQRTSRYVQVSPKLIPSSSSNLFAVEAEGDSMNQANIRGKNIDDGDLVIVDPSDTTFQNGDYVLSIINGLANIKRFYKDESEKQIVLVSESSKNYSPIYIHEEDLEHYLPNGKIIMVLKQSFEKDDVTVEENVD